MWYHQSGQGITLSSTCGAGELPELREAAGELAERPVKRHMCGLSMSKASKSIQKAYQKQFKQMFLWMARLLCAERLPFFIHCLSRIREVLQPASVGAPELDVRPHGGLDPGLRPPKAVHQGEGRHAKWSAPLWQSAPFECHATRLALRPNAHGDEGGVGE